MTAERYRDAADDMLITDPAVTARIEDGWRCTCVSAFPDVCSVHRGCTCRVVDVGVGTATWYPRVERDGNATAPLLALDPACPEHGDKP